MTAAVRVTNRSGAPVAQRDRVSSVAELGVAQLRVRQPDEESSEWLSEWGDAPEGPSGFGPSRFDRGGRAAARLPARATAGSARVAVSGVAPEARATRAARLGRARQPRHRRRGGEAPPMARHQPTRARTAKADVAPNARPRIGQAPERRTSGSFAAQAGPTATSTGTGRTRRTTTPTPS